MLYLAFIYLSLNINLIIITYTFKGVDFKYCCVDKSYPFKVYFSVLFRRTFVKAHTTCYPRVQYINCPQA